MTENLNAPDPTTQLAPRMDGTDVAALEPAGPSLRELAQDLPDPEEAGIPTAGIRVRLEGGQEFTVRTVNRDYLRWDKTPPSRRGGAKDFQTSPFIFATFLAWSAATREGLVSMPFDAFTEAAVDVERVEELEVPPTQ